MEQHTKFKEILFGLILLTFIVGGYIFMQKSIKLNVNNNTTTKNEIKKQESIKLDTKKDFIYFTDEDVISEELDINYINVNFNFAGYGELQNTLNSENAEMKALLKYDTEKKEEIHYDGMIYAKYKRYYLYSYADYMSLYVEYFEWDPDNLVKLLDFNSYVFSKSEGKRFSNNELLSKFGLNTEKALDIVKDYLNGQNLLDEEAKINVDATMEGIEDLVLYVDNKTGKLVTVVLVKSDKDVYNEVINLI